MEDITVTITKVKRRKEWIQVHCPYYPKFVRMARELGGKWKDPVWEFDARAEDQVRSLCIEVFGTDGPTVSETCTVLVHLDHFHSNHQKLWALGRKLVYRHRKDWTPAFGEGVILLEGGFASSGGSRNNPTVSQKPGTILQVWDVPLLLARKEVERNPQAYQIVEDPEGTESKKTSALLEGLNRKEKLLLLAALLQDPEVSVAVFDPYRTPIASLDCLDPSTVVVTNAGVQVEVEYYEPEPSQNLSLTS